TCVMSTRWIIWSILEPLRPLPIVLDRVLKPRATELAVHHQRNGFRLCLQEARNRSPTIGDRGNPQVHLTAISAIQVPTMILIKFYRGVVLLVIEVNFIQRLIMSWPQMMFLGRLADQLKKFASYCMCCSHHAVDFEHAHIDAKPSCCADDVQNPL